MRAFKNSKKKKFKKIAFVPFLIGGATILSALWLWSHSDDPNKGLSNNINNALKKLDDLKTNSWYESDVDDVVQRDVSIIENYLNHLKQYANEFNQVMASVQAPTTIETENDIANLQNASDKKAPAVNEKLNIFVKEIEKIIPALVKAINNFTSTDYQKEHSKPSTMSDISGWIGEAVHGRWGLIANDFISAANALKTLLSSLQDAYKKASNIDKVKAQYQEEIAQKMEEFKGNSSMSEEKNKNEDVDLDTGEEGNSNEYANIAQQLGYKPSKKEETFLEELMKELK